MIKEKSKLAVGNPNIFTLEYEINVPVCLLISMIFSQRYTFISDGTFIKIGIFRKFHNNSNNRNRAIECKCEVLFIEALLTSLFDSSM